MPGPERFHRPAADLKAARFKRGSNGSPEACLACSLASS